MGGDLLLSGTDLKIKRIKIGLNACEIALELKVSKSYISMLERERQSIPLHIYKKWVSVLKI
jgi:transcriptional regulator with XRE-family HTH domain